MNKVEIKEMAKLAGGVVALSHKLGLSRGAVSQWVRVPAERVIEVEALTGVSRSVIRPDLHPVIVVSAASAPAGSILKSFHDQLTPVNRTLFENEIAAARARGLRGEEMIGQVHAAAVRFGARFSLDAILSEYHAGRWHETAERAAMAWIPVELRLRQVPSEIHDRLMGGSQSLTSELAAAGRSAEPGTAP